MGLVHGGGDPMRGTSLLLWAWSVQQADPIIKKTNPFSTFFYVHVLCSTGGRVGNNGQWQEVIMESSNMSKSKSKGKGRILVWGGQLVSCHLPRRRQLVAVKIWVMMSAKAKDIMCNWDQRIRYQSWWQVFTSKECRGQCQSLRGEGRDKGDDCSHSITLINRCAISNVLIMA